MINFSRLHKRTRAFTKKDDLISWTVEVDQNGASAKFWIRWRVYVGNMRGGHSGTGKTPKEAMTALMKEMRPPRETNQKPPTVVIGGPKE